MRTAHTNPHRDTRLAILTVFLLLAFVIIVLRLVVLQVVSAGYYKSLAEDQYDFYKKLIPSRGEIKVTDNTSPETFIVAGNITKQTVFAIPRDVVNAVDTAKALSEILEMDPQEIQNKISDQSRKYVILKRQLTEDQENRIRQLKLSGIGFDPETVRYYPEKNFLSHVLGFVGYRDGAQEKEGLYGLERYFQSDLAGRQGSLSQEKDATGAWIFGGKRDLKPAVNGSNLILTVDRSIQFNAQMILQKTVERHQADGGCIIVMNARTGAIMAMASSPDFDPNEYNKAPSPSVYNNSCTTGSYEPGSVFKPVTMAAAIDKGKVSADTTYVDEGEYRVDDFVIKNSDNKAHGVQTMTEALEKSLNTGVIFAKNQVGDAVFLDYMKKFGYGQKTGIELPEGEGELKNLNNKIAVNFATASFGQGFYATPIQLVQSYSAFANGGKMVKPYIVQAVVSADGKTVTSEPVESSQIISPKTAKTIGAMLVNVVENGHGKRAGVPGYYIAGKTGTAQVAKKNGKGYEENNNIGSFVGFGPVDDPKFVMLVRVDHPRTVQFAESTAAPAFGELAQFIVNYYNIPPTRNK